MSKSLWLMMVAVSLVLVGAMSNLSLATPITSGLVYWLDANDLDGDGNVEGVAEAGVGAGLVNTWTDRAAGYVGGDAAQNALGAIGERPLFVPNALNGRPVVRFDGVDDHLTSPAFAAPLAQANQVFMVWKADSTSGPVASVAIDGLSNGNRNAIVYEALSPDRIGLFAGAGSLSSYYATPFSDPIVLSAVFNDGAATMRIDGTTVFTGGLHGTDPMDGVTVGSRFAPFSGDWLSLDGYIAELLIFDTVLSDTDRNAVEQYLTFKWFDAASNPIPAPEPSSISLLMMGAAALLYRGRRNVRNRS